MKGEHFTVANARPLYVALPIIEEDGRVERVVLEIVVAWRVEVDARGTVGAAEPIGVEDYAGGDLAIYDAETEIWTVPGLQSGQGLESAREVFRG